MLGIPMFVPRQPDSVHPRLIPLTCNHHPFPIRYKSVHPPPLRSYGYKMIIAQPCIVDGAVDMLTFALSGPGVEAVILSLAVGATILFSNFEIGPRALRAPSPAYFLHLKIPKAHTAELPDGTIRDLKAGETILRFSSLSECESAAITLRRFSSRNIIYRMDGVSVKTLSTHHHNPNTPQATWPTETYGARDAPPSSDDSRARAWAEYEMLGAYGKVDAEWAAFVQKLGGFSIAEETAPCKLCGGSGYTRCHRCGGVKPSKGSTYVCDCVQGRRPCEWCTPDQQ